MHIAFIHPDLGLGGAERLIIDSALSLQSLEHSVTIYTPYLDPTRCFPEVHPTNPTIPVHRIRSPIPRAILGKFHAILAALRCALLALYVCLFVRPDVAVVDIVSLPLLVLRLFRIRAVFYCHYPDALLAATLHPSARPGIAKRLYRRVVDALEELALHSARATACNSRFTARVFSAHFPRLRPPVVIYPCVAARSPMSPRPARPRMLLSLNRYERKKAHSLAVETLAVLTDAHGLRDLTLTVAGGYDTRLAENVEHFAELERLVAARGLTERVTLLRNVPDAERRRLLAGCLAVLYTPSAEHFGIVPLEAMAERVPVVAVASGGPCETVLHGESGMLCESSAKAFAEAVLQLERDPEAARVMGEKGCERAEKYFSRDVLGRELQNLLVRVAER